MSPETIRLLTAEIVLIAVALAVYVGGAFVRSAKPWAWIAGAGIVSSAAALWWFGASETAGPGATAAAAVSPIISDPLAWYGRWLALALGAALVLLASRPLATGGTPEYLGSLLLAIAGLMIVSQAGDLILMFVGLELISIPTYILLYLGRRDAGSQESAAKYFFLSVLASAMLLYGFSFLYGVAGSTHLAVIRGKLAAGALTPGFDGFARMALVLILAGLSFRVAAVPFHFYAPDVYQGTTHPSAAFLSAVPKAAGLVALVRIVLWAMPEMNAHAWRIVVGLSILTMTLGNLLALWQDNLRRLLAYSSIANAGYMLIGLAVGLAAPSGGSWDGIAAMLFYLCVYAAATLGMFAALAHLGRERQQVEVVDELAGLGRDRPLVAAVIALFLLSLAGLPPLGGLWGKLLVFGSALGVDAGGSGGMRGWFIALAVIGGLNAAVAAFYYLRIVGVMYFRAPLATPRAQGGPGAWMAAMACAALVLALGVYPVALLRASNVASPTATAAPVAGEAP